MHSLKQLSKQADVYSVGAILFRLLLGVPPTLDISEYISKKRLELKRPSDNVFEVPFFLKDYIISNEMCYILVRLLHQKLQHRYANLSEVRRDLLSLKENIFSTPTMLRKVLGHPVIGGTGQPRLDRPPQVVEFAKNQQMNEFSLKYLAKFIFEHNVESLSINGGPMPLLGLKTNSLVELNLRDQGLFSEDLFVLSQFLKHNVSVTRLNLSKNFIGYRHLEETQVIELKMKN